jgi:magnesium-transporting ATPase (P-type)
VHWHALDAEEVAKRLDSGKNGLDAAHAKQRLENSGPNSLEAEDGVHPWALLLRQVQNPLIYLLTDESALTGESEPVAKQSAKVEENTPMADRHNMVWMSTNVTGGRGQAVVVDTGMDPRVQLPCVARRQAG